MSKTIHLLSIILSTNNKQQTIFIKLLSSHYCQVFWGEVLWLALLMAKQALVKLIQWMDCKNLQLRNCFNWQRKIIKLQYHFSKFMEEDVWTFLMKRMYSTFCRISPGLYRFPTWQKNQPLMQNNCWQLWIKETTAEQHMQLLQMIPPPDLIQFVKFSSVKAINKMVEN